MVRTVCAERGSGVAKGGGVEPAEKLVGVAVPEEVGVVLRFKAGSAAPPAREDDEEPLEEVVRAPE